MDVANPTDGQKLEYSGGNFKNVTPTGQPHTRYGKTVQYVEGDGNDLNHGYDRAHAKKSLDAALKDLNTGRGTGTVYMGSGIFQEPPMIINGQIRIIGAGTAAGGNLAGNGNVHGGTRISLKDNEDGHLFNYQESGNVQLYEHHLLLEKMTLDGNRNAKKKNPEEPKDILRIDGGGFNTVLRDITFTNAERWAIWLEKKMINIAMFNIGGGFCGSLPNSPEEYDYNLHGGLCMFNATKISGADTILISGLQADGCGRYPFVINHEKSIGGTFILQSSKFETGGANNHVGVFGYFGSNKAHARTNIHVIGSRNNNYSNGKNVNTAFFHQLSGKTPAHVILQQVGSSGDFNIYKNDITGEVVSLRSSPDPIPLFSNIGRVITQDLTIHPQKFDSDADATKAGLTIGEVWQASKTNTIGVFPGTLICKQ